MFVLNSIPINSLYIKTDTLHRQRNHLTRKCVYCRKDFLAQRTNDIWDIRSMIPKHDQSISDKFLIL